MSIVTANRTLQSLRRTRAMEFRSTESTVFDWKKPVELADFDPNYRHLKRPSRM